MRTTKLTHHFQFSDYFSPFDISPGDLVTPCPRVSHLNQSLLLHRKSLLHQHDILCYAIEQNGGIIVPAKWPICEFGAIHSGRLHRWLDPALEIAHRYGSYLLAESIDRFIRHPEFHSSKNIIDPEQHHVEKLFGHVGKIKLMTLLHPNTPYDRVDYYHSHRSSFLADFRQPSKLQRRKRKLIGIVEILHKSGERVRSIRQILLRDFGEIVDRQTVANWLKEAANFCKS